MKGRDDKTPASRLLARDTQPVWKIVAANSMVLGFFTVLLLLSLQPSILVPCTDKVAQCVLLGLLALIALHFFSQTLTSLRSGPVDVDPQSLGKVLGTNYLARHPKTTTIVVLGLCGLVLWLGSYTFSPLHLGSGRIPTILGFGVTTSDGSKYDLVAEGAFSIRNSAWASISPSIQPQDAKCDWNAAGGGTFDNSQRCDTAYYPSLGSGIALLELRAQSACQAQQAYAHLRVTILP